MKTRTWLPIVLVSLLSACTYTDGQCWLRSDDSGGTGAGGGVIVPPYGGGDYGEVPPTPQDAADSIPPDCAEKMSGFPASLFKFKTTVEDDGEGKAGGYQQARATLMFIDGRQEPAQSWTCAVTIKMPLRTEKYGTISAERAAEIASDVTTIASTIVMHSQDAWQPTLFCGKYQDGMNAIFQKSYKLLGGQATAKR